MDLITMPVYASQGFPCTSFTVATSWQHAFKSSVHSAVLSAFKCQLQQEMLCCVGP